MINIVNLNGVNNIHSWLKDERNIYVGRANRFTSDAKWGNPFIIGRDGDRKQVVELYEQYILGNDKLLDSINELKGKVLGCWCDPDQCHAEILHKLAGNRPIYTQSPKELVSMDMAHNHFTRKSSDKPPPMSPKPTNVKPTKLNNAQLQEKVELLEQQIVLLLEDSKVKEDRMKKMEDRIIQLEADEMKNASYLIVQRNVATLLSNRIAQLEQYTRRYSVIVSGIDRKAGETNDNLRAEIDSILQEAGSTTKLCDVDKLHRNGPRQGNQQDIIVRFKTHEAKESFYKKRKNIKKEVWVKPSLSHHNSKLLKDAKELIKPYTSNPQTYDNPPQFVFANVHGDLQVKLVKETADGTMFYSFNSIQKLFEIINKADNHIALRTSDNDQSRFDDPKGSFPRSREEIDALDAQWAQTVSKAAKESEVDKSNTTVGLAVNVMSCEVADAISAGGSTGNDTTTGVALTAS